MLKKLSLLLSDYWVSYLYFIYKHRHIPSFKNPRSLSEKINYIKIYNRNPLRAKITDRLWVREYVKEKSSELKFSEILWHGDTVTQEVWANLPEKFVLKANHGSQMVEIVTKSQTSFENINSLCKQWMDKEYALYGREWVYNDQKKYIIVESFLSLQGGVPPDFKFFCFNGKVEFVQVDVDRFVNHKRNLYSSDFKKLDFTIMYPSGGDMAIPPNFKHAIKIAEQLSVDFDFIRVDLYLLNDGVYFGELTNTPEGGFGRITPKEWDFKLGAKLPSVIER